ncbi:MAG: zinc-ribbon domain-containing protein [Firmicutes bacterium]|nr:zinc-ribbon domain-containing protein [Bacillota bacterium]
MALMYCRECGKQVSDKAKFCPHCGCPIYAKLSQEKQAAEAAISGFSVSEMIVKNKKVIIIAAILIVLIVIATAVTAILKADCNYSSCKNTRVRGGYYCSVHTCAKSSCFNSTDADDFYCFVHRTDYAGSSGYSDSLYESAPSVLSFSDIDVSNNSSYTICTGTLTNSGSKTYKFVEVKGAFKDYSGTVVDTDWTYAVGSEGLEPGESTSFRMSVPKDSSIRNCEVSILDYDT